MKYAIIHDNDTRIEEWKIKLDDQEVVSFDHPMMFYKYIEKNAPSIAKARCIFDRYWPGKKDILEARIFSKIKNILRKNNCTVIISSFNHEDLDVLDDIDLTIFGKPRTHGEITSLMSQSK